MKPITSFLLAMTTASVAMAQTAPATAPAAPLPPATAPAGAVPAQPPVTELAPAQPQPPVKNVDPATLSLLDQSASVYKGLKGYQATFAQTLRQGGKTVVQAGTLKWASPQKVRMEWKSDTTNLEIVSDGTSLVRYIVGRPQYLKSPFPTNAPPGVKAIAAANLEPFLSLLLAGINPLRDKTISAVPLTATLTGPMKFGDETYEGVKMVIPQRGGEFTITLWLDPTTHLLSRVEGGVQNEREDVAIAMLYSDVQVNPEFAPDTFTFAAPKGVTLFVPPKPAAIGNAVSYDYDRKIKVGIAPYALSGPDLTGKVRSISAYKGKVLLVDFWATWCGPCIGELPNVLKNYSKYHGKGFEVLGVSLDSNKAVLSKFIKNEKMPWPQLFDGREWGSVYAAKYKVQAIPFTLLIGKDGKVAAINPRGIALEPAIQKALKD